MNVLNKQCSSINRLGSAVSLNFSLKILKFELNSANSLRFGPGLSGVQ